EMQKRSSHFLIASALALASFAATSSASAQTVPCGYNCQPGLIAWLAAPAPVRPAPCPWQGPYIVQQGPTYDRPAIVAPQATYQPSRTINYTYGAYYAPQRAIAPAVAGPVAAPVVTRHATVRTSRRGKAEVVNAHAVVHIYNRNRMDIRLYR